MLDDLLEVALELGGEVLEAVISQKAGRKKEGEKPKDNTRKDPWEKRDKKLPWEK